MKPRRERTSLRTGGGGCVWSGSGVVGVEEYGARGGEVAQADIIHEAEARADFLEDGGGDLCLLGIEFEGVEEIEGARDGEGGEIVDIFIGDGDGEGLRSEEHTSEL